MGPSESISCFRIWLVGFTVLRAATGPTFFFYSERSVAVHELSCRFLKHLDSFTTNTMLLLFLCTQLQTRQDCLLYLTCSNFYFFVSVISIFELILLIYLFFSSLIWGAGPFLIILRVGVNQVSNFIWSFVCKGRNRTCRSGM